MRYRFVILLPLLLSAMTFAGSSPRCAPMFRTDVPPKIDGYLDDACWRGLPWTSGFRALGGGPAGQETRFIMVWDDRNLYLAVRMEEPNAKRLVANVKSRDGSVWKDDSAELFVTSERARKPYYHFVVNSIGTQFDEEVQSAVWNASWQAAAKTEAKYWSLECAIPFAAIGFTPGEGKSLWGNVNRTRCAGEGEVHSTWTPLIGGFHDSKRFGTFRLMGKAGPDAQKVAARMDALFREAMEADMRQAWEEVVKRSEVLASAERTKLLHKDALRLKQRVEEVRRVVEKQGLLEAALSGQITPTRALAGELRTLEYRARIEQLLADL